MKCEISYQVYTVDKEYRQRVWKYGTEEEAEKQYGLCLCNKGNKIIELQMAIALKETTR